MKVGAQLYTLREYCQNVKDLDYSLGRVREIGYETVQISGVGPIPAEKLRALCDRHGLEIVLTHTDPERILNDTQAVIREHETLGCRYIGIGMMPQKYRSPEWLWHFADDYKEPAGKIARAGMLLMYHNHNVEFQRYDGKLVLETLMESFAPEEMGFTLDTYWVQMGGGDICEWLTKLKGRTPCVHLKDFAVKGWDPQMAAVGEGNLPWGKILATCRELGGVEHLLVEQDVCPRSPFECLESSYQYLKKLGAC